MQWPLLGQVHFPAGHGEDDGPGVLVYPQGEYDGPGVLVYPQGEYVQELVPELEPGKEERKWEESL